MSKPDVKLPIDKLKANQDVPSTKVVIPKLGMPGTGIEGHKRSSSGSSDEDRHEYK